MNMDAQQFPIVVIYKDAKRPHYRVLVNGVELKYLKSFSVTVDNTRNTGVHEAPHCTIEQYLLGKPDLLLDISNGELAGDGERSPANAP